MARAEIAQAQNDAGHALLAVEGQHPGGEFLGLRKVALGQFELEDAFDQQRIVLVGLQGLAEEVGGQRVVAQLGGDRPAR